MPTTVKSVSVSGCYWSGSSVIIDILAEHSSCVVVPEEFSAYSYGQFFEEVIYPLTQGQYNKQKLENNLNRFLIFNKSEPPILFSIVRRLCHLLRYYPEGLFQRRMGLSKILGKQYQDCCQTFASYLRELEKNPSKVSSRYLCSIINQILVEASKGALLNVGRSMPDDKLLGIFDQLMAAPYAESTLPFLPDTKFVNVDRDWRDQYVEMRPEMDRMIKVNSITGARPWGEKITSKIPSKIEFFVELRKHVNLLKSNQNKNKNTQIIWLQFEDLVQNPEMAISELFNFLDIDKAGWNPSTVFFPAKSFKNIGKWRNSQYLDEIEILESRFSNQF